jgi:hypothetical protein
MNVFGVDIARSGEDKSVAYVRDGASFIHLEEWSKTDLMESAGRIERLHNRYHAEAIIIDADGIGAGVYDRLREQHLPVFAFHGSSRCERRDRTGELGFRNLRSFAWWNLRELLEPTFGRSIEVPRDKELFEELVVTKYSIRSGALIEAEGKDDIKKRLGRSPDKGDAMAYSYCGIHLATFEASYLAIAGLNLTREGEKKRDDTPPEEVFMTARQQEDILFKSPKANCDLFDLARY